MMKPGSNTLAFLPFIVAAVPMLGMLAVCVYLYVFGVMLGYNVSSFDPAQGPQWPFSLFWALGVLTIAAFLVGAVWTPLYLRLRRHRGE